MRAFCAAAKETPQAHLDVLGDGPLLAPCRQIVAAAEMTGQVTFHGAQPHDVVRDHLARAEVFLQHSVTARNGNTEGLPTAIQEAMASGTVTVSTRHAGIPEAVEEGKTGFLVDEFDAAGFQARIETVLSGGHDLRAMGQLARQVATERFDNRELIKVVERRIAELA